MTVVLAQRIVLHGLYRRKFYGCCCI